jgi:hypothetical protein
MIIFAVLAFMIGLLAAVAGLLEMLHSNDGWETAFKLMGIAEAILVPGALLVYRRQFLDGLHEAFGITIFLLVGLSGVGILFGAPCVFVLNVASSSGEAVRFEGPVLSKYESKAKSTTLVVQIQDRYSGQQVKFSLPRDEYESVKVGDPLSRCMQMGGLGIPFRWRYFPTPACTAK